MLTALSFDDLQPTKKKKKKKSPSPEIQLFNRNATRAKMGMKGAKD
jgi:hypothetical protein